MKAAEQNNSHIFSTAVMLFYKTHTKKNVENMMSSNAGTTLQLVSVSYSAKIFKYLNLNKKESLRRHLRGHISPKVSVLYG